MKTPHSLLVVALLALGTATPAQTGEQKSEELEKLQEKARQFRSEGRWEEAKEVLQEARRAQAERREREGGRAEDAGKSARREPDKEEPNQAGKDNDARRRPREREEAKKRDETRPEKSGDDAERKGHLQEAIKHLRAAGLPDQARRLEQQASAFRDEGREREFIGGRGPGGPAPRLPGMMQEMVDSVKELRGQMQKMAREMDELREQMKRERGDGGKTE